ncbi:hypothetical protein BV20DRAFT_346589 [Pilatotrama ljubarskyi]|nr:hypothetical protein BV20DRAFT_346589 [Pilatotrama ljubarskyi]
MQQLAAAEQWLAYAFEAEGKTPASDHGCLQPGHATLELLELFVRFYWALYSGDDRGALVIVNAARKKRGFGYRLPEMSRTESEGRSMVVANSDDIPDAVGASSSTSGRRRKGRRGRKSKMHVHTEHNNTSVDSGETHDSLPDDGTSLIEERRRVYASNGSPAARASITESAADGPNEDDGREVFALTREGDIDELMELAAPIPSTTGECPKKQL